MTTKSVDKTRSGKQNPDGCEPKRVSITYAAFLTHRNIFHSNPVYFFRKTY